MDKREKRKEGVLVKIWEEVEREHKYFSSDELVKMIKSKEANTRLSALLTMRKQIEEGDSPDEYLELARRVISDSDNNCRWQSLIVVSESTETRPDLIWEVISEFGDSMDDDMRTAIATILLEHLLDYDFDKYFPKIREEILQGRYRFINTLDMCCFFDSGPKHKKVQSFLKNAKRGLNANEWKGQ